MLRILDKNKVPVKGLRKYCVSKTRLSLMIRHLRFRYRTEMSDQLLRLKGT